MCTCICIYIPFPQEPTLRVLRHLPDIIRLQQMLIDKYHRRIDAAEATSMSIQEFMDSLPQGEDSIFLHLDPNS